MNSPEKTPAPLTVAICAYNPRRDHLERTIKSLQSQTLPGSQWDFLLVDNQSKPPLSETVDLSWHPRARVLVETSKGISAARARAMKEFASELLLFVDDDNVLAPDYLENALRIANSFPQMGAFSGQLLAELEKELPAELRPHLGLLALREFDRDAWSNFPLEVGHTPVTAGMCLRRPVAEAYLKTLAARPAGVTVGSAGKNFLRGEDDDICYSAQTINLGVGMFKDLRLTHLIPAERLTEEYLCGLAEGIVYSGYVVSYLWKKTVRPPVPSLRSRLSFWKQYSKMTRLEKRFADARVRAEKRAWETIRELEKLNAKNG
jgi:glycosyltransferase involved in cell wall biosynthesis